MSAQLGLDFDPNVVDLQAETLSWQELQPGTRVAEKSNLFPRREVQPKEAAPAQGESPEESSGAPEIQFEDFQKVDLRTGYVVQAQRVKGADKLLKLDVDCGEAQPRSIVSGLAEYYAPESLQGRQVVLVSNLKPRKLRGILSQGMILAVHAEKGLQLVQPGGAVPAGSRVS